MDHWRLYYALDEIAARVEDARALAWAQAPSWWSRVTGQMSGEQARYQELLDGIEANYRHWTGPARQSIEDMLSAGADWSIIETYGRFGDELAGHYLQLAGQPITTYWPAIEAEARKVAKEALDTAAPIARRASTTLMVVAVSAAVVALVVLVVPYLPRAR